MKPRGGSRKHPADCQCGSCPKLGRPKQARPTDGNLAREIKAKIQAKELWLLAVQKAKDKAAATGHTGDLVRILMYLDDRDLGRPVDTVNHVHDKPIDLNVNISMSELVRKVRQRKQEYERNRS